MHERLPHGALPSTQPCRSLTKVTLTGANPAGTARPTGARNPLLEADVVELGERSGVEDTDFSALDPDDFFGLDPDAVA